MRESLSFLFDPSVQQVLDHFCALLDVRIAFFSPQGEELRVGAARRESCTFCQLLRRELGYESTCQALDQRQREAAAAERRLIAYECHAGLTEAIMPAWLGAQLIGFVMIGQFRCHQRLPAPIARAWRRRYEDDRLVQAFREVPAVPAEKREHVLGLFRVLVEFIQSQQLVGVGPRSLLRPILAHLEAHPERALSLREAAAMIHRSPSTVSHRFQQVFGQSFKQVQIDIRLDRAEAMLRAEPDLSVQEVAYRLGYQDPLYFSRLFRRHRGYPPSACRERQPRQTP